LDTLIAVDEFDRNDHFIVNTTQHGEVGHWILVYIGDQIEIFDPLGNIKSYYNHMIFNFFISLDEKFMYNTLKVQSDKSKLCGYFCLFFVFYRTRGWQFNAILNLFCKNLTDNDAVVETFVKSYFN